MKQTAMYALASLLAGACALQAQNSQTGEVKAQYNNIKNNITRAADKMPESDYSFKPTDQIRSFGELVSHIADTQTRLCGMLSGENLTPNAASKTSKADLTAALKASFDACDKAYNSATDATANETVGQGRMQRSRVGMLYFNVIHDNEMYGVMGVYLRLKNIVPPSSEGGGMAGGRGR